jgi:hypothetical protein
MSNFFNDINELPNDDERLQIASRSTQVVDAAVIPAFCLGKNGTRFE